MSFETDKEELLYKEIKLLFDAGYDQVLIKFDGMNYIVNWLKTEYGESFERKDY